MKSFLELLESNKKEYKFTVKLACPEIDDGMLDKMEGALERYELVSASKFKKSPLQKNPLDFPRVANTEVHISNVVTNYPCTSDLLRNQISDALGLDRYHVVVYTENDPRAAYDAENNVEGEYKAKVGTEYDKSEEEDAEHLYGQAQADTAVDDALESRKDRRVDYVYNNLSIESEVPDAKFEKAPREGENVKSVFFGRNEER